MCTHVFKIYCVYYMIYRTSCWRHVFAFALTQINNIMFATSTNVYVPICTYTYVYVYISGMQAHIKQTPSSWHPVPSKDEMININMRCINLSRSFLISRACLCANADVFCLCQQQQQQHLNRLRRLTAPHRTRTRRQHARQMPSHLVEKRRNRHTYTFIYLHEPLMGFDVGVIFVFRVLILYAYNLVHCNNVAS